MKKLIYILFIVALSACQYENPTPKGSVTGNESNGTLTPVVAAKNVKAHVENQEEYPVNGAYTVLKFNYFNSGDAFNSTDGWYSPNVNSSNLYVAKSAITVNARFHAYVKHTSMSFEIHIRRKNDNKLYKSFRVINTPNWSGLVDLTANNIQLEAGDQLGVFQSLGSGTFTVYPNGDAFGVSNDHSYFYVEAN